MIQAAIDFFVLVAPWCDRFRVSRLSAASNHR